MCGIAGSFAVADPVSSIDLVSLRHRGPDACGEYFDSTGHCWLGHTRLSILDLSPTGIQPIKDASGRFVAVFNGEIYNHHEIRQALGHTAWRGTSDSETLVEAWARFGADCLPLLRGMFAFGIYDQQDDKLTLIRDRYGIKPLYFSADEKQFQFASEIRSLSGGKRPVFTSDAIATYLAFGHLPTSGKLTHQIKALPAGSLFEVDRHGVLTEPRKWYCPSIEAKSTLGETKVFSQEVRRLVEDAIREHLLSDVPVGCFLSGGIDSSIVALIAARYCERQLETFTVGFPNDVLDERTFARQVAKQAASNHHEIEVDHQQCQQWIVDAVQAMDCPSADAINTFIVSKAVAQCGMKVAFSGLGADELFGGYPSFRTVSQLGWLNKLPFTAANRILDFTPLRFRSKFKDLPDLSPYSLAIGCRRWRDRAALQRFGISAFPVYPQPAAEAADTFSAISLAEMDGYMEPMLLRDSDQMSMAVSLELRVPFLDHRLVEYVLSLPAKVKQGQPPKSLLINAFKDVLPREVWDRPKMGFSLPMQAWMNGPMSDFVASGLDELGNILNKQEIEAAYASFKAGWTHWTRLWSLVVLGHYTSRVCLE